MNNWDICRIFLNEVSILCSLLLFGCVFLLLDIRMELEEFCCYFQMLFICCENPKLNRQGRRLWLEVPDLRRQLFHATSPQLPPLSSAAQLMFLITRRYFSPEFSVSHSGGKGGRGRGGREKRVVFSHAETSAEPSQSVKFLPHRTQHLQGVHPGLKCHENSGFKS